MPVELTIHGTIPSVLSRALIKRAVQRSLRILGRTKAEIAVVFVTSVKIAQLNRVYRKQRNPTDVLSFSYRDIPSLKQGMQGDLFICPSYVKKQAALLAVPLREELLRVLVHGILHLAGYTHERSDKEARMFSVQERLVRDL